MRGRTVRAVAGSPAAWYNSRAQSADGRAVRAIFVWIQEAHYAAHQGMVSKHDWHLHNLDQ